MMFAEIGLILAVIAIVSGCFNLTRVAQGQKPVNTGFWLCVAIVSVAFNVVEALS